MTFGPASTTQTVACYRHNQSPAVTTCNRCGRPICTECMVSAPVGWQCTGCVEGHAAVTGVASTIRRPVVTIALIVLNVVVFVGGFLAEGLGRGGPGLLLGASPIQWLAVNAQSVAAGQYWRILSSGFVHFGLLHIGFNMWVVWLMGSMLEPRWGHIRYLLMYLAGLVGGSLGALLLSPAAITGGASGAAFGLLAGAFVASRMGGRNALRVQVGGLIVANLVFTLVVPNISLGGHVGGLLAGGLTALVYELGASRVRLPTWVGAALVAALVAVLGVGSVLVATAAVS